MGRTTESHFVRHEPCPDCGSRDNLARYSDGGGYCFGCGRYERGEGSSGRTYSRRRVMGLIEDVEVRGIRARKITDATAKHFGYGVATYKGRPVQVAPYYDASGRLVAQKIRTRDKQFRVLGDIGEALPFGAQCWPRTGRKLVVTEGEIDALTMSQVQGNKWPVVSIACGAGKQVRRYIAQHRDYFLGFEEVVLMFDSDEPGREAARVAAEVIGSRARIAELPQGFKDPNEMLVAGKVEELVTAMWKAKPFRPEGIVTLDSLKEAVTERPAHGLSWPWPDLTELTYGIQQPYIYTIGAATGAGKTEVLRQVAEHLIREHREPVGLFLLEEEPPTTALGLASVRAGKLLHTPEGWDEEAFEEAWKDLTSHAPVYLYDSFGVNEWESVREKIEFLYHSDGVRYFFVDHLTAFAAAAEDERKALEEIMGEMSSLVTRLGITIFLVTHLATPDGTPHEEGGRVMVRHFKGARAIGFWSHGAIGLERDQQHEDLNIRHTTTVRILKLRGFGWQVGKCCWLKYDTETGLLVPTGEPKDPGEYGFVDETPLGAEEDASVDF